MPSGKWKFHTSIIQQYQVNFHCFSSYKRPETCLSPTWRKEKGVDKIIANEWKKFVGLTEINAKYRYVQFCRSLKTFGSTFFQIKVIKFFFLND